MVSITDTEGNRNIPSNNWIRSSFRDYPRPQGMVKQNTVAFPDFIFSFPVFIFFYFQVYREHIMYALCNR